MQGPRGTVPLLAPQMVQSPASLCSQSSVGCVHPRVLHSPIFFLPLKKACCHGWEWQRFHHRDNLNALEFILFCYARIPKCWYLLITSRFLVTHLTTELPHKALPARIECLAVEAEWVDRAQEDSSWGRALPSPGVED